VAIYGRIVVEYFTYTALWYGALRDQVIRIMVVRDPTGRRHDKAFFCTDGAVSPGFILESYAHRWTLEVTFHNCKQSLGFEDPQNQTATAVRRTAPFALLVYDLVLLWAAEQQTTEAARPWPARPWYRRKVTRSFPDLLTALRLAGWRQFFSAPSHRTPWSEKPFTAWPDAVLATA
jgi:hypothetical protein